ncbi:MAG: hypothetical protein MHPSP_001870, partial [Paramarteilia canceri]
TPRKFPQNNNNRQNLSNFSKKLPSQSSYQKLVNKVRRLQQNKKVNSQNKSSTKERLDMDLDEYMKTASLDF